MSYRFGCKLQIMYHILTQKFTSSLTVYQLPPDTTRGWMDVISRQVSWWFNLCFGWDDVLSVNRAHPSIRHPDDICLCAGNCSAGKERKVAPVLEVENRTVSDPCALRNQAEGNLIWYEISDRKLWKGLQPQSKLTPKHKFNYYDIRWLCTSNFAKN